MHVPRGLFAHSRGTVILSVLILLGGMLVGCESDDPPSSYVARVGDYYLTQEEINQLLPKGTATSDSSYARQQIIDQWVRRTLLLREAERLNLAESPEVQRQLKQRRQSALVTAMTERLHQEANIEPSDRAVRTYFERNRKQLRLNQPYLHVRYLSLASIDTARALQSRLRDAQSAGKSVSRGGGLQQWVSGSIDTTTVKDLVRPADYFRKRLPVADLDLSSLREGDAQIFTGRNDQYYLLHLVKRYDEGSLPELSWVKPQIQRRLQIRARKQMYAREVERLLNRARTRDALEIPSSGSS